MPVGDFAATLWTEGDAKFLGDATPCFLHIICVEQPHFEGNQLIASDAPSLAIELPCFKGNFERGSVVFVERAIRIAPRRPLFTPWQTLAKIVLKYFGVKPSSVSSLRCVVFLSM